MKLSNFRNKQKKGDVYFANVDVTTGIWPFTKTRTEELNTAYTLTEIYYDRKSDE